MTSMPMLVAEELDFDWTKIKTEWAGADPRYGNPNFGGQQLTAGSNSVRGMWKVLREAGATARVMLVTAAAQTWGVAENTCTTDKGEVIHQASGRRLKYGTLVDKAAALAGADRRHAQGSEELQAARQLARTSRCSREGQRQRHVRHRREAARAAHGEGRAVSGLRREGRSLQRGQSEGRSWRDSRSCRSAPAWPSWPTTTGQPRAERRRSTSHGTKVRSPN